MILYSLKTFQAYKRANYMRVRKYNYKNGIFSYNYLLKAVREMGRQNYLLYKHPLSMCQGRKMNWRPPKQAKDQLRHAKKRWTSANKISLWLYALHNTKQIINSLEGKEYGRSTLQLYSFNPATLKLRDHNDLACPGFSFQTQLQAGDCYQKWGK